LVNIVGVGSAGPLDRLGWWVEDGHQSGAAFGWSVASAGDVNGDGYSDVVVGAPTYDDGQADEGGAFLYLGSANGLAGTPHWSAEGDQDYAWFGNSVASAGDVNGDGYSDVVIGAYAYENGETDEGRAFLYTGSPTGLSSTPAWTAESDQTSAYFGWSVAGAGDVNGDGYADVVVGAYAYDNGQTDEGRAFLYLGSADGLSVASAWSDEANQDGAFFGNSVATAGDVNGDGYADVIVGAPLYDDGETSEGAATVYLGSSEGLSVNPAWSAEGGEAIALFGWSVASAGDVNGDGYADVIVGAYGYTGGQTDEGRALVYLGSAAGLSPVQNWTVEGDQDAAEFGTSVATGGDVNADGYSDVVVGAPWFDSGATDEGQAFVYLGSAIGPRHNPTATPQSNQSSAFLGRSVAGAGDVNGDGYDDVITGAYLYDHGQTDEGVAVVYPGRLSGLGNEA
jgi:hypothetical protein